MPRQTDMPTVRLLATRIEQSPGRVLYSFVVDGKKLRSFASISRVRRDEDNALLGYQRPEVVSHINEIRSYLESETPMVPNALVLAFDHRITFEPIDVTDDDTGATVGWLRVPAGETDEMKKPGWIVDGQQRSAAIREARIDKFPIFVVAFVAADQDEQAEQFILVNSTKPLPKSLIYELLPGTSSKLPAKFQKRRFDAAVADRLNFTDTSPFHGRIKSSTNPDGKVNQTAVMNMVRNSRNDGLLYRIGHAAAPEEQVEQSVASLSDYWHAVADVFPDAWSRDPRHSRLTHGAGIVGMGYIMDAIADRYRRTGVPTREQYVDDLTCMVEVCCWTSGHWEFGPGMLRKWDQIQNTQKDVQLLANFLLTQYRELVWNRTVAHTRGEREEKPAARSRAEASPALSR